MEDDTSHGGSNFSGITDNSTVLRSLSLSRNTFSPLISWMDANMLQVRMRAG